MKDKLRNLFERLKSVGLLYVKIDGFTLSFSVPKDTDRLRVLLAHAKTVGLNWDSIDDLERDIQKANFAIDKENEHGFDIWTNQGFW